jgi:hypothetical protein
MDLSYYLKYLGICYAWTLGLFAVVAAGAGALYVSGVQANYGEFLSFWAIYLAVALGILFWVMNALHMA